METKPIKLSTHFYSLHEGDVFSPKGRTNKLFMKTEQVVIKRNGEEVVNVVSLENGKLIFVRANDEVLFYYNARTAL